MEALVRHGADVDQVIEQQGSPLHAACSNQHLSTVKKLLELGENTSDLLPERLIVFISTQLIQVSRRLLSPEKALLVPDSYAALLPSGRM